MQYSVIVKSGDEVEWSCGGYTKEEAIYMANFQKNNLDMLKIEDQQVFVSFGDGYLNRDGYITPNGKPW